MVMKRLIKHNPDFMSDQELEAAFVVRQAELQILADLVRTNHGEVNQHALVIGPRGMGKTMLMSRLALLVRSDEELNDSWYPIAAPEEIYDAGTEGEIWLAILKSLADQQRREEGQFERWNERYEALVREQDEERLRARTLGALTEFSHEQGKRLLVLIENLQMLLGEQFAKDADWDLRKTLLNRPEIMLMLTATARFRQIEDQAFAAYELFRELELKPLSTDDCRRLWQEVSGQNLADQKIRPMEILTGGNPRLLAILATFAPERPLQELLRDLAELIDDHTPFLKSNIDALPAQERRVFVTLARLWEPATARQVGDQCRLSSNTASAVLKSLVNRGAVVERGKKGRGKLYQVAERIYCIYYLMRLSGSEADRMRAFVRFMGPLYGEDGLARSLAEAACGADVPDRFKFIEGYRELLSEKIPDLIRQRVLEATPSAFLDLPEARDLLTTPPTGAKSAARKLKGSADHRRSLDKRTKGSAKLFDLIAAGEFEEALEAANGLLRRHAGAGGANLRGRDSWVLVAKGYLLGELGQRDEQLKIYDEVFRRFAEDDEAGLRGLAAWALVRRGDALGKLERGDEQLEAYDEVFRRFADDDDALVRGRAAEALGQKGDALGKLGRRQEQLDAYDEVFRRFEEDDDPAVRSRAAEALGQKGDALGKLGRRQEQLDAYDEVFRRFEEGDDAALRGLAAGALGRKGDALGELERRDEQLEAYDEVIRRFEEDDEAGLRGLAAWALVRRGDALGELGRTGEQLEAYDKVIHRFAEDHDAALHGLAAGALGHKGDALGELERRDEQLEAYDEVIRRFEEDDEAGLRGLAAWALVRRGDALGELGRTGEQLEAYDKVIQRFAEDNEADRRFPAAWALVRKGDALGELGRTGEELEAYDQVIRRFAEENDPKLRAMVARALNGKSWLFYSTAVGQPQAAIKAGRKAVELARDNLGYRHTLACVYGLMGSWHEAYLQMEHFLDHTAFVATNLDDVIAVLIDAAADGQAERVLEVLSGTAAERAVEPLMAALRDLAGEFYSAPQEVEEVKKDVLARIEDRRKSLGELRQRIDKP